MGEMVRGLHLSLPGEQAEGFWERWFRTSAGVPMLQVGDPRQSPIWSSAWVAQIPGQRHRLDQPGRKQEDYGGHSSVKSQGAVGVRPKRNKRQFRAQHGKRDKNVTLH